MNIEEFIEGYYNRHRLHSAQGCRSPEEFEQKTESQAESKRDDGSRAEAGVAVVEVCRQEAASRTWRKSSCWSRRERSKWRSGLPAREGDGGLLIEMREQKLRARHFPRRAPSFSTAQLA
jgi:hypothetical protein